MLAGEFRTALMAAPREVLRFPNPPGQSILNRGKRGERSIVPGAFRCRLEWPIRMHAKRKSGAEQQQTNRAGKWPGPASGPIDQIAEHEGRNNAGNAEAEIHHAARGTGISWRNV